MIEWWFINKTRVEETVTYALPIQKYILTKTDLYAQKIVTIKAFKKPWLQLSTKKTLLYTNTNVIYLFIVFFDESGPLHFSGHSA